MGPCVGYPILSYSYPEDKKKLIFHTDALHTCLSNHLGLICTNLNVKKNHFLHDIDAVVVLRVTILTNSRPQMLTNQLPGAETPYFPLQKTMMTW